LTAACTARRCSPQILKNLNFTYYKENLTDV
jgi:hypothetical protein